MALSSAQHVDRSASALSRLGEVDTLDPPPQHSQILRFEKVVMVAKT